jgi:pimeloyl-ACP methyl ester carboxylesterase
MAGVHLLASEGVAAELSYADWPGGDPPIVLVPGIFSNQRALTGLARAIAPTRRVLAFDLRGRGRAPLTGPFGIGRHAEDLWCAIDALGLQAPVLVGHSLGAFVVAAAAGTRPGAASALVLLDGGVWSRDQIPVELVHALFADDRARLGRSFADVEAYAADRELEPTAEVLHELGYELGPSGDLLSPVMPAEAFDEDVASIAADTRRNALLAAAGCPVLVIRALRGIGGNPLAQMVDDATLDAAREAVPRLQVIDFADATHGQLVRAPFAGRVAAEILGLVA